MPSPQIACGRRWRRAGSVYGSLRSKMLNDGVIPVFSLLVPQNKIVAWHGRRGILFFEIVAFRSPFADSGLREVHVVEVRPRGGPRWSVLPSRHGSQQR